MLYILSLPFSSPATDKASLHSAEYSFSANLHVDLIRSYDFLVIMYRL